MPWSYTGDPSSSLKDEVRYIIGDTDASAPLLQDEEINFELKKHDNNTAKSAVASCQKGLAKLSKEISMSIGPFKQNLENRFKNYQVILAELKKDNQACTGMETTVTPGVFKIGMHDEVM